MEWFTQVGSLAWLEPGQFPRLAVLSVVALVIAIDTLPLVGLAVPGDVAVIGVVTVVGVCAGPSVILAVTAGSLLGWSLGYLLGRTLGRRRRAAADAPGADGATLHGGRPDGAGMASGRAWFWRHLGTVSGVLAGSGDRVLALAPFLPVVNALAPVAAGAAGVGFRRTIMFAALGSAGWASLYTLIAVGGQAGLGGLGGLDGSPAASLLPLVVAAPISVLATVLARRALRSGPAHAGTA